MITYDEFAASVADFDQDVARQQIAAVRATVGPGGISLDELVDIAGPWVSLCVPEIDWWSMTAQQLFEFHAKAVEVVQTVERYRPDLLWNFHRLMLKLAEHRLVAGAGTWVGAGMVTLVELVLDAAGIDSAVSRSEQFATAEERAINSEYVDPVRLSNFLGELGFVCFPGVAPSESLDLLKPLGVDPGRYRTVGLDSTPAFDHFRDAGGVLGFALLEVDRDVPEGDDHLAAALRAFASQPYIDSRSLAPRRFRFERAEARRISVEAFLGEGYDLDSEQLVWSGSNERDYPNTFAFPLYSLGIESDTLWCRERQRTISCPHLACHLVSEDDHWQVLSSWFNEINDILFGGFNGDLIINEWSTDWAFNSAQRDAWNSPRCWTIQREGTKRVAGIVAPDEHP